MEIGTLPGYAEAAVWPLHLRCSLFMCRSLQVLTSTLAVSQSRPLLMQHLQSLSTWSSPAWPAEQEERSALNLLWTLRSVFPCNIPLVHVFPETAPFRLHFWQTADASHTLRSLKVGMTGTVPRLWVLGHFRISISKASQSLHTFLCFWEAACPGTS